MSVNIKSSVIGSASYETSLTKPPLVYTDPSTSTSASGTIPISSVIGLQSVLDAKLNDSPAPVGVTNVFVSGTDLNLLAGSFAGGLTQADFTKLAAISASAAEINYTTGVTSPIQTQIDTKYSGANFTAADQIFVSTGAGVGSIETIIDVLAGTVGVGYEFANLKPATVSIDFNNQLGVNALDPVAAQDVATKNYVDTAVLGGGTFLPLSGGVMSGAIDLDGNSILLDGDGNTTLSAAINDTVVLNIGGVSPYTFTAAGIDLAASKITSMLDPIGAQDGATKNYVDTTSLPLSGGVMSGIIDMDGNNIILDALGTTFLNLGTNSVVTLDIAGSTVTFSNDVNVGGMDISNLPAIPTTGLSAITTTFADGRFLKLDGTNSMSATLDMGNNNFSNISAPTAGTEVGNRSYNDARYLGVANNLSDIASVVTARTNLGLATVAVSGDYNDLINQPVLSAAMNDLTDVSSGAPAAGQDGYVITWNNIASSYLLSPPRISSVFGRTGAITAAFGDYDATQVAFTPSGNIIGNTADAAIQELDTEKLATDGSMAMSGSLNMSGNQIVNLGLPFTTGVHEFTATDYRSGNGGNAFLVRTSAIPAVTTPTYSFVSQPTTGMWINGADVTFSVQGVSEFTITSTEISAENKQLKNVASPTATGDAINLGYLNGIGVQRILGKVVGVDLLAAGAGAIVPLYTVGLKTHVVSNVILVATSYNPGIAPSDPVISIGTSGNPADIINPVVASWGPAGASDQATYFAADQGAATPNAAAGVVMRVDTPAGGSFTSMIVDVFVVGFEL